jgi:lipopolysaccharide export system protein LptA
MRIGRFTALFLLLFVSASLWAQMTPNAPVKNFRFPRFGENGYTQWVLQGEKGIYDSEEQIRVEGMALRVYSGDERMAKELTLDSPEATIRLKEDRAFSKQKIRIEGANFTITGTGWEWIGETKEIVVEADTVVEFTQAITGGLSEQNDPAEVKRTVIKSDQLVLQTTEEDYNFEFSGSVRALSGDMDLRSNILIALADAPGGEEEAPKLGQGKLDSVREIVAIEEVKILQGGRTVRAGEAKFLTREGRATLTGSPQIEVKGAFLSGAVVRSHSGELVIEGSPSEGRAQMILTDTGGLGLQGMSALSEQTIVLANRITMQEVASGNRFLFEQQVEVMSGAVQLQASKMTITADQAKKEAEPESGVGDEADLKVGEVRQLIAEGGVRIEQKGQVATGEKVVFYPAEQRCELTGQPKVTNGEAVITGHKMELKPKLAIVTSNGSEKVNVELPAMPDLGYQTFTPSLAKEEDDGRTEDVAPEVTIVRSRLLRMIEEPERTLFRFTDEVEVSGTNLEATCERLDVIAKERSATTSAKDATERLEVERIEAHDSVVIKQAGRTATASRAFIMPKEGKVVLEDNAVVEDDRGRVSGFRMTLLQGQRKAIVEGGGGPGQERARITLPALPGSDDK